MVTLVVVAVLAGIVLGLGLRRAGHAYRNSRGVRVVTCPESRRPAAVSLRSWRAAVSALAGRREIRVQSCSRWPGWSSCAQACVKQIQEAPRATMVEAILSNWCRYNMCTCCGAPLARLHVGEHQPHLLDRELRIFEWK